MNPLGTIKPNDYELAKVVADFKSAIQPIFDNPITNGTLLENVSLSAGSVNLVNHGLNREPRIWLVVNGVTTSTLRVWMSTSSFPKKHLALNVNEACTLNIYVG